jgi:CHASE2 domain-containing sensor protein
MFAKTKLICSILLIISMLGLSIIAFKEGNWRPFVLGLLYATANIIIFIV